VLAAAVGGLLGLVLASCGAGQTASTSQQGPSIPGVNAQAGSILVRNALVPYNPQGYPAGADLPVELSIFNGGPLPVRLVEVGSPVAGSVTVLDGGFPLEVAPGQRVAAELLLTGLAEPFDGLGTVPVGLSFDTGPGITLEVPMAPPEEPEVRPTSVVEEEEH
jgi:copper(I)-binding protein